MIHRRAMTPPLLCRAAAVAIALAGLAGIALGADGDADPNAATPATPPPPPPRASWMSDRIPIEVGQIVTVIVDEQTSARERVSRIATAQRSQAAELQAAADGEGVGPTGISSILDGDSRDIGEAHRQGDLVTSLSARVVSIDAHGIATIEGAKVVTVDGRKQEVKISGSIRTADIPSSNTIYADRIADLKIDYRGKKIGPRAGILGKILGMLWP